MTKETRNVSINTKFKDLAARVGLDGFLLSLLGLIILAYLWPGLGKSGGPLPLETISTYGVALIFFFYGLRLSPEKLRVGLSNWHLHLLIQGTTFVLFPVLILIAQGLWQTQVPEILWLGAFYLAALPSTVSSSVVMVSIAGGNLPAAIFNASISSLLGVFITPLWMGWFLQASTGTFDFGSIFGKLILQVLLPVTLGIGLHQRFGYFAENHRQKLRLFDQVIILIIVFNSFCESFARNLFRDFNTADILLLGLVLALFFFLVMALVYAAGRALNLNRENQITALFCGSKKSLVHGTVMSKVIFPDAAMAGLVLLPIMIYHALQLIFASIIAQRFARKKQVTNV
ncbi:transporter [Adhaeribacter aerolatus]|uniref:Transporter n=1 Tax=Adhaeribacter aerolatus TaxID=670289 RepID=A0A512AY22_9BACT|nr:bile acid:sodium symporter family protein [Adhaeribacter aerolatus]GEO04604.1 transporter [Adhaeribacter aerolatus]